MFSNLGAGIVLALLAAYALWRHERRVAIWIVASGVVAIGGNALIKLAFERDRPVFDKPLHEIGGYSFPSGHSAGSGMLFTVAILMTIVLTGRGWKRRIIITVLALIGLGVGASRIFLGVHYLSDVVAGLSFGTAVALGLWILLVTDAARLPHELAALTGTGRKRAAVVLNPSKIADVEAFKERVRLVAQRDGWKEPLWFETTIEDPGHGQASAALRADVDLIVAAGGDGTVRAVCEEVARTGVAVGILPHGTGNLLARNLSIPLNTRDALDVVFGGQDRAIDLSTLKTDSGTNTTFLVMAGLGMDAAIMTGVNDQLKAKVGWLAYFVSGVKAARFPAMKVQISVDDGEFKKFRARTVVVGNVGFLQGGIPLLPDAQIDDGTARRRGARAQAVHRLARDHRARHRPPEAYERAARPAHRPQGAHQGREDDADAARRRSGGGGPGDHRRGPARRAARTRAAGPCTRHRDLSRGDRPASASRHLTGAADHCP